MESERAYEKMKAEIAAQSNEEVRATPDWRKFQIIGELTTARREVIKERLKARYPKATDEELRRRFGIVWLGAKLAKQAFGWEVDEDDSDLMIE